MDWLATLKDYAERHPIAVLRFSVAEWLDLLDSKKGVNEFTITRRRSQVSTVKAPAPCLLIGQSASGEQVRFGLISSKSTVSTLDSRMKVSRSVQITPSSGAGLSALVTEPPHAGNLATRLQPGQDTILLSPKLSSHLIERLASIDGNQGGLRALTDSLLVPKKFNGIAAQQQDAVQTALAAFGLWAGDHATSVELVKGKPTALARVSFIEDSVVEHDARHVPGYSLIKSDVTGRALFVKGEDELEVYTANRRDLEHCFGVDLIYINLTKKSVVMLQYKMLEPAGKLNDQTDWIYRPDKQLDVEIARMKAFAADNRPGPDEYRLNAQVFYLKFVRRDAALAKGGIITPLDHFESIRADPSFKGLKGGLRLSYRALNGQYLRQTPFLDLVRCGYVGAHAGTTANLTVLINEILNGNKAVVAAIQRRVAV